MEFAQRRGWQEAVRLLCQRLQRTLRQCEGELHNLARRIEPVRPEHQATAADICRDLMALDEEFGGVEFDRRAGTLSVCTESIELDGVLLGRFRILLDLADLASGGMLCYSVIALEPNPAACNPSVTHPHVQDEALCEGQGHTAIRTALAQRRLLDFFQLVAGVLRTYNEDGPFCSLDGWSDSECPDCGELCRDGRFLCCMTCDDRVCEDCSYSCPGCEKDFCIRCTALCQDCDIACCQNCLSKCSACRRNLCAGCLESRPDQRCSRCHVQKSESNNAGGPGAAPSVQEPAVAPLQPHGVGQAPLPA
jgi:hypothetical protein